MPQPYNYNLRPSNPANSILSGIEMRTNADQAKAQQLQAQQTALRKSDMQKALGSLPENPTANQFQSVLFKFPEIAKTYESAVKNMTETELASNTAIAQKVYAALKHKKTGVAVKLLNDRADALENSGDIQGAKKFRDEAKFTKDNPLVAETGKGLFLASQMGDKFADAFEGPSKIAKTEAETQKLIAEGKKLKAEAQQITNDKGKLPSKDRPEWTLKIANQYLKEGGDDFAKIDRAYENIKNASPTGAGGLNLIISFMKTIDPTSIVSGNEKTTAENAPGWTAAMRNTFNRVFSDGELGKTTVKQFKEEALKIRNNAKKRADKSKNRLGAWAKRLGLDTNEIFNLEDKEPTLGTNNGPPSDDLGPGPGARIRVYNHQDRTLSR
jgi:hypothetical protein